MPLTQGIDIQCVDHHHPFFGTHFWRLEHCFSGSSPDLAPFVFISTLFVVNRYCHLVCECLWEKCPLFVSSCVCVCVCVCVRSLPYRLPTFPAPTRSGPCPCGLVISYKMPHPPRALHPLPHLSCFPFWTRPSFPQGWVSPAQILLQRKKQNNCWSFVLLWIPRGWDYIPRRIQRWVCLCIPQVYITTQGWVFLALTGWKYHAATRDKTLWHRCSDCLLPLPSTSAPLSPGEGLSSRRRD